MRGEGAQGDLCVSATQDDIDSLLAQAEQLAHEAEGTPDEAQATASPADGAPLPTRESPPSADAKPAPPGASQPTDLGRILKIEVPVIVKLAECRMPVSRVVGLNTGAIIEFEKPADAPLDLMINNKSIGLGQAVKVGENFGLRVTHIGTLEEKILALGR